jgi:hypothetical protein
MKTPCIALSLALATFICSPALAQEDPTRLRQEINELRERLTRKDDEMLKMARRFDARVKELQDQKEKLLDALAARGDEPKATKRKAKRKSNRRGKKKSKKAKKRNPKLDLILSLNFPVVDLKTAGEFIEDVTELEVTVINGSHLIVDAQVENMTLDRALDAIVSSVWNREGTQVSPRWKLEGKWLLIIAPAGS